MVSNTVSYTNGTTIADVVKYRALIPHHFYYRTEVRNG